jgi:hypothetical protein
MGDFSTLITTLANIINLNYTKSQLQIVSLISMNRKIVSISLWNHKNGDISWTILFSDGEIKNAKLARSIRHLCIQRSTFLAPKTSLIPDRFTIPSTCSVMLQECSIWSQWCSPSLWARSFHRCTRSPSPAKFSWQRPNQTTFSNKTTGTEECSKMEYKAST